jgi:hypothetical protein
MSRGRSWPKRGFRIRRRDGHFACSPLKLRLTWHCWCCWTQHWLVNFDATLIPSHHHLSPLPWTSTSTFVFPTTEPPPFSLAWHSEQRDQEGKPGTTTPPEWRGNRQEWTQPAFVSVKAHLRLNQPVVVAATASCCAIPDVASFAPPCVSHHRRRLSL